MKFRNAVNGFNKSDVMNCIESLLREIADQKKTIKDLEEQVFVCKASLKQAETKEDDKDMCSQCDAVKVAQAQLGAAMLDAKRFSELLLKDANDRSAQIFNHAMNEAETSTKTATQLADAVKQAKSDFTSVLDNLHVQLSDIILSFTDFRSSLETKAASFDFTTEFAETDGGAK